MKPVNPPSLGAPRGYSHGILAPAGGRLLFIAGQNAAGAEGDVAAGGGFVAQFEVALSRVLAVLHEAGGEPGHIGRFTIYVTDLPAYEASRKEIGAAYRRLMGRHYPAVALVEVKSLVDRGTVVEIEATAVLPPAGDSPGAAGTEAS